MVEHVIIDGTVLAIVEKCGESKRCFLKGPLVEVSPGAVCELRVDDPVHCVLAGRRMIRLRVQQRD